MATAAAEEAPGKGLVDGIKEVQEVTESSGPVQPKSLEGPAPDIRQRFRSTEKPSTLEPVVSEESLHSSKAGDLSPKKAAEKPEKAGVESEQGRPDRSLLEVIGDGVGAVRPANFQRQKLGYAKLGSQPEGMDDTMQDGSDQQNEQLLQPPGSPSTHRVRPSSQSAKVTVGTMDTESSTNTRSNPSQGNAASSRRSKTAEWALLVTSVVLEAISAIFEQLGYPLTSMVMAFVALLLSILDLILKARQRGITCDWCFYRQSSPDSQNRKPFASLVHYLGLAGALWQCSFTTVGYYYTHQKLVNPIKLCLLPFILALCVLISKVVKSSQHEM